MDAQGTPQYKVEAIIAHRQAVRRGRGAKEYLVRWKGFDASEDTWEPPGNLANAEEIFAEYLRKEKLDRR